MMEGDVERKQWVGELIEGKDDDSKEGVRRLIEGDDDEGDDGRRRQDMSKLGVRGC
jgi:hypothetical protein